MCFFELETEDRKTKLVVLMQIIQDLIYLPVLITLVLNSRSYIWNRNGEGIGEHQPWYRRTPELHQSYLGATRAQPTRNYGISSV